MTAEEYLRWEETQLERHEFVDGQVRQMGAIELWPDMTAERDLVVRRLGRLLTEHLCATGCKVITNEAHDPTALDIEVCCGGATCLVVEVTTPKSTPSVDHGNGFSRYRGHPDVREIVQIDLAHRRGDVFQRYGDHGKQWLLHAFEAGETVTWASVELRVSADWLFADLGPAPVPLYRSAAAAT